MPGADPKHGYLCVRTKMLKRLSSCAKRLGALSHSTRIPEENTSTCSASKMEETRCCVRGREMGGQRRRRKRGEKGMRVRRRKCVESAANTAADRDHAFIQSLMLFCGTLKTHFFFFFYWMHYKWHKPRQKKHFLCICGSECLKYKHQITVATGLYLWANVLIARDW